jgi:hypothetical protein
MPMAVGYTLSDEYYEVLRTSDEQDLIWTFLEEMALRPGLKIYAHGSANSDARLILDCLTRHGQTVQFLAGLGRLKWVEANITFEDSYLVLGRPLRGICEALGVERKLEWIKEPDETAWDAMSHPDSFRSYLKRDVLSLSEALDKYAQLMLELFGVTPSTTLSLTAVKAFGHRFCKLDEIEPNIEYEHFIRAATHGGRNEIYRRYGENILMYDIKGMFVSCYDTPIPVGKMRWTKPGLDRGTIVEAKVKVPKDLFMGPLPHKHKGRLCFPVGEFTDVWDVVELRNAVNNHGVDVKLIRQLECDEAPVMKEFGELMNTLRQTPNEELSRMWKLFGLRLSGKFGQKRSRTEIRHVKDIEDLNGWYPIDNNEVYHEKVVPLNGMKSPYIKPAVSMRIRAEARVRHYEKMMAVEDVYYCDTDSIYTREALPIGNNLGELHLVGFAQRAYFIGPKLYGYVDEFGNLKQKTSGISDYKLGENEFERILKGETVIYDDKVFENWREILKGKGVNLLPRTRLLTLPTADNRIIEGIETRPFCLPE